MDTVPIEMEALERVFRDPSAEPIKVSYGLLRSVTDNFSSEIGRGGFGVVFLGYLGNEKIAVKKLSNAHCFSYKQFLDEIKCLIRAKHKNIVRFLGYCSDTQGEVAKFDGEYVVAEVQEKLLIFEYVSNGNIQHYLEEKPSRDDWHIRYKMINGICQGLRYLHEERIGHLDLKPENVMLDSHMEPKIADFGLSRFLDVGKSVIFTTKIYGTMGYIAPETMTRGELSFMSDIYALGMIVIKLLIGPSKIDFDNWHESLCADFPQMKTCIDIARACVEIEKSKRPTIVEIIDMLNEIDNKNSSKNQASSHLFPLNDAIGAYPLELLYHFVPNMPLFCSMALSNKTGLDVGYMVSPYSPGKFHNGGYFRGIVEKMSTVTVRIGLLEQEEMVPLEDGRLYITMYIMKSNEEIREFIFECNGSFEELRMHVEARGGTTHSADATAVLFEHDPTERFTTTEHVCTSHGSSIKYIEVHPTEPWLLKQTYFGISIWNLQTHEKIYENEYTNYGIFILQKKWLVTAERWGSFHVRMCPTMEEVTGIDAHYDDVSLLAVHPSRPLLMTYSISHSLKIWDWDQDWSCIRKLDTISSVHKLMFNPNSPGDFVTFDEYHRVKVWTLGYSKPMATTEVLEGDRIEYICNYSNDLHLIAVIGSSHVQILDLNGEKLVHTLFTDNEISAVACHPTRSIIITASVEGNILVWDSATYRLKKAYECGAHQIMHIGFTGSRRLVIGHERGISVLDVELE